MTKEASYRCALLQVKYLLEQEPLLSHIAELRIIDEALSWGQIKLVPKRELPITETITL